MQGVTIIETATLQALIGEVQGLRDSVLGTIAELKEATKPYLTTKEVCELLNKSENWVLLHKHDIGCSKRTGCLLFKRKDVEEFVDSDYFRNETRNCLPRIRSTARQSSGSINRRKAS